MAGMDPVSILAMLFAVIFGMSLFYIVNRSKTGAATKVIASLTEIFDKYGEKLKEDDPTLYQELEDTLNSITQAMSDGRISLLETCDIMDKAMPLAMRLSRKIKKKYPGQEEKPVPEQPPAVEQPAEE